MGKEFEANVAIGSSFRHKSGVEVSVHTNSTIRYEPPGETAQHEAAHGVINPSNVKKISKIPGPGYLGVTEVFSMDTVMAAAAHADGHGGTGHDMMIVRFHGSYEADVSAAKSTLASRREHKAALAGAVEAHGTLSNGQVREVMSEVDNGKPVTITEKKPNGERRERQERIKWNVNQVRLLIEESEGVADLPIGNTSNVIPFEPRREKSELREAA